MEARGVTGAQNQPIYDSGKAYICPWCRSSPRHPTQHKWTIHCVCKKKHEDSINTIYFDSPVQQHTLPHSLEENHINICIWLFKLVYKNQQMHMYKICFITCNYLPTCFNCFCDHHHQQSKHVGN